MLTSKEVYNAVGICSGCEYVGSPSKGGCNEVVLIYRENGEEESFVSYVAVTGVGVLCEMAEKDSEGWWERVEK